MTIFKQACEEAFEERTQKDPEFLKTIIECKQKIDDGFFPEWYVNVIMQHFRRDNMTYAEVMNFAEIHSMIHTGQIAWFQVGVSGVPFRDADIKGNNSRFEALNQGRLFTAEFWGGTQDEDGFLEWHNTITANYYDENHELQVIEVEPMHVPLEVGYQPSYKTWFQITQGLGLARYPYGSEVLTVFVTLEHNSGFEIHIK